MYITHNNKKVPMYITPCTDTDYKDIKTAILVECEKAGFKEVRDERDLLKLIDLMPDLIEDFKKIKKVQDIHIRIETDKKLEIEKLAKQSGYKSLSKFIIARALQPI